MKIGYARTLTIDQNLDLQLDVLKTAVVKKSTKKKYHSLKTIDLN